MGTMRVDGPPSPLPPIASPVDGSTRPEASASATPRAVSPVDEKLAGLRARFRRCYSAALSQDPDLRGPATFSLRYTAGQITKVELLCPKLPPELTACLTKVIESQEGIVEGTGVMTIGPACGTTAK